MKKDVLTRWIPLNTVLPISTIQKDLRTIKEEYPLTLGTFFRVDTYNSHESELTYSVELPELVKVNGKEYDLEDLSDEGLTRLIEDIYIYE